MIKLPDNRAAALSTGSTYYFTGRGCKNGHVSERQANNGTCVACNRAYANAHYSRNADDRKSKVVAYRDKNPDKVKRWSDTSYQNNKPAAFARARKRDNAKINRTPAWLTEGHQRQIAVFFKEAKRLTKTTGIPHHVDHIVPLQGETVSGLHVPWNLQVVPAAYNLAKGNKFKAVA